MKEKKTAKINKNLCVACGTCLKVCPMTAITIIKGCFAQVNEQRCIGCGRCAKACPASIIQIAVTAESAE